MQTSGFNCKFTFQPLECRKCKEYLRNPQTVSCCKANFCYNCIMRVRECPICRESFTHSPNKKLNEVLLQFQVHCTKKCGWSGPLKEHDQHLNVNPSNKTWLDGCPKVRVCCLYCMESEPRHCYLKCLQNLPEMSIVYDITRCACSEWEAIGRELNLHEDKLQAIKQSNNSYQEMLKQWRLSTTQATWRELLNAFRKPSVDPKIHVLAANIEQGLLCDRASEQQVSDLIKEAQNLMKNLQMADMQDEIESCLDLFYDKIDKLHNEKNIKLQVQGLGKDDKPFPITNRTSWFQSLSNAIWNTMSDAFKTEEQKKRDSILAHYQWLFTRCCDTIKDITRQSSTTNSSSTRNHYRRHL